MTTTTINDISDLSRILQENPEWAETLRSLLLSREVLTQPEKMAQLTERLDQFILEIREQNRRAAARMDQFDQFSRETQAFILEMRGFIAEQREINVRADARMDALTAELREFIAEQREINARADAQMERFDQFIQEMREYNARADARMEKFTLEMREHNELAKFRMDRFDDRLGSYLGDLLENRLHGRIVPLIANRFGLRRTVILKSRFFQMDSDLYEQLDAAEDAGQISLRQNCQLQLADFILRGVRKDTREPAYVVVEASRTIKEYDISRARERADILAAVTGAAAFPAAIGNLVAEPQESQAADSAVTILQVPEPEPERD